MSSHRPPPIAIAPAGHGLPTALAPASDPTMPYTCLTCTRRKVKCDKVSPVCSTCRRSNLECRYQAPAARKRRRRPSDSVHERLAKYERLLEEHGLLPQDSPTNVNSGQPHSTSRSTSREVQESRSQSRTTPAPSDPHKNGKIIYTGGKARWVDTALWRALGQDDLDPVSDEGEDNNQADEGGQNHAQGSYRPSRSLDPLSAALLSHGRPLKALVDLHPTYERAMVMWRTHVECVEPIVKILHIPSTLQMLQRAASSPGSTSKTVDCICFAVYHFAVSAMSDSECENLLGESRPVLRTRYHDALCQSLVNAQFLRTTEMGVIQAYVLFCLSVRTIYDQQTFWILTGIAVRLGQRIGLHRDGEDLGLKPFDVQMRRRLFWQLLPLDGLASQLTGTGIAIPAGTWSTKQPWNLNDDDVWPDMTEKPTERTGATDMIFCLTRTEVGKFHQSAKPTVGNWPQLWRLPEDHTIHDLERSIESLESAMETKYLRYCDIVNPVHCLTMSMARGGIAVARFRARMHRYLDPKANPDPDNDTTDPREEILPYAMRVLDYAANAMRNPTLSRFRWHLEAFFTWDALVVLLNELRRPDPIADPETAWPKIKQLFESNYSFLEQKRALHVAAGTLALRAWAACPSRTLVAQHNGQEPAFIASLKESAVRRQALRSRTSQTTTKERDVVPAAASLWTSVKSSQESLWVAQDDSLQGTATTPSPFVSSGHMDELFNFDDMDWSYWEQLMENPDEFPAVAS